MIEKKKINILMVLGNIRMGGAQAFLLDVFAEVLKREPWARLACCGAGALMPSVKEKTVMAEGLAAHGLLHGVRSARPTPVLAVHQRQNSMSKLEVQRLLVGQEVDEAHGGDALVVAMDGNVVAHDDDFLERVADLDERGLFLLAFLIATDVVGRLYIVAAAAEVADEVDFELCLSSRAVLIGIGDRHDAYIDVESTNAQLIVDNVLHDVRALVLPEVDAGIAQPHVGEVVFAGSVNIVAALHIVAHGTLHKERVAEMVQVDLHRSLVYAHVLHALEGVHQLVRIGEAANAGGDDVDEFLQFLVALYAVALLDVGDIGLGEQVLQIGHLLLYRGERENLGQSAVHHIFIERTLTAAAEGSQVLAERQRMNPHLVATATELGDDILRQETGVGASHIDVGIGDVEETVEHVLKLADELHLVEQDVVHAAVGNPFVYIVAQSVGIPQLAVHAVIESNADDVLLVCALLFQILPEKVEEQERLSAPTHAGNHFYHAVMLSRYEGLQVGVAQNNHRFIPNYGYTVD